jgi:Zn-dependent protease with chaperone function
MSKAGSAPRSTAIRIGGAAVAMIVVAELAVLLLAPSDEPPKPVPVSETDYFTAAELDRAHDYRGGQTWLLLGSLVVQGGVLVSIAFGRPRFVRRRLDQLADKPLRGAAVAGATVAVVTAVATLPLSIWSHERAVDVGLSTQSLDSWLSDVGKSTAITAVMTAIGTVLLLALVRRFPRRWWIPGTGAVVVLAALVTWIGPVLLAPVFNKFDPLPEGSEARREVLTLAERAGVEIGEVYRVDASRRSTALNAYVDGIGSSKRVVLYDNLLDDAERPELRSIVAHELGHVAHDDIRRGLTFVAIVAPFGLLFTRELAVAVARRAGADPLSPAAVPAYLLALTLTAFVLNIPGNQLSRKVEASADAFALELTNDPAALVDVQVQLARTNISDPDPPALLSAVFSTHPSTVDRIGAAIAYARERGLEVPAPPR